MLRRTFFRRSSDFIGDASVNGISQALRTSDKFRLAFVAPSKPGVERALRKQPWDKSPIANDSFTRTRIRRKEESRLAREQLKYQQAPAKTP